MSNNKQQTAVEWLYDELTKVWYDVKSSKELLKQAKEMEKEQKADTWNNAINAVEKDKWESFEQFYDLTYGGNK